jgi:hypothetical protein
MLNRIFENKFVKELLLHVAILSLGIIFSSLVVLVIVKTGILK